MVTLLLVAAGAVVLVVALVAVGRETFVLRAQPRQALFDLDEAVDRVGDDLPFEVSAKLSYDEVRILLGWYLDLLAEAGVPGDRAQAGRGELVVVDRDMAAASLAARAAAADLDVDRGDVQAVLASADAYFAAIGAIGPRVQEPLVDGSDAGEQAADQPRRDRGHTA